MPNPAEALVRLRQGRPVNLVSSAANFEAQYLEALIAPTAEEVLAAETWRVLADMLAERGSEKSIEEAPSCTVPAD